jgi:hypothetical protein
MLIAKHVAGPLRDTVGTAQIPAVLASRVIYVNSSQIMGELDYLSFEATYSRGK